MVFVYAFIDYLGEFFGLPYNQVKIVLWFFLSVFFSYMMVFIKSKNSRYAFSFISGFWINVFMYEWQVMHPIAMLLITYFWMKYLNRDKQHLIIFVVLYTYQSWMHIDRMIYNFGEWGGEVTSFTMNLVCRLISLGFWYRDAIHQGKGGIPNDKSINKLPSFFQVWSYTFNAPSCVAGPFFEYKDFEDWMELKGHYQSIPSTTYSGIKRLLTSLLWIPLASFFHTFYKIEGLASEDFWNKSFLRKVVQMYFTGMTLKYQYYLVWALNDTSLVFSGLAYSGVDKDTKMPEFNRVKNINEYIKLFRSNWIN